MRFIAMFNPDDASSAVGMICAAVAASPADKCGFTPADASAPPDRVKISIKSAPLAAVVLSRLLMTSRNPSIFCMGIPTAFFILAMASPALSAVISSAVAVMAERWANCAKLLFLIPSLAPDSNIEAIPSAANPVSMAMFLMLFDMLSKSIRNMAMDTGFAAEGIASMFESGARLGIKNSNLAQFAHLSAMTATALDMTAESAGDAIARMKNAVGIPMQKMEGFLDVINNLDSTTAAKGADLIEILTRSGGALASAGVNPH